MGGSQGAVGELHTKAAVQAREHEERQVLPPAKVMRRTLPAMMLHLLNTLMPPFSRHVLLHVQVLLPGLFQARTGE